MAVTVVAAGVLVIVPLLVGAAVAGFTSSFGFGDGGNAAPPAATTERAADPFPWGQCTWYVARYRRVTWSGDAADWLANAEAQDIRTTTRPSVGAIVVYRRGGPYDAARGHVALVVAVTTDSYAVTEMNYRGLGIIDVRILGWPDASVLGFVP